MNSFEIIIPTLFGMESVTAREVRRLGYHTESEDGRVSFKGDYLAVCKANMWVRSGERVLIKVGEFNAYSFEELFEKSKALPWADWLPKNCAFPVKGYSLKSKLYSVPDCQSIIKKSVVDALIKRYKQSWFEETGPLYQIQFSILKDKVTIMIDTTGAGLHKRGYREMANAAPLRETLASAMVQLSFWRNEHTFCDPFCGSGTIAIEAAMLGKNIAPGLNREFAAEKFVQIPKNLWWDTRKEAHAAINKEIKLNIHASDIDPAAVALTKQNSELAGVRDDISVTLSPLNALNRTESYGTLICNPPYGERLGETEEAEELYRQMGQVFKRLDKWNLYVLTPNEHFELLYGKRADKKRKLYNGMIKCNYYQYYGPKPPRPTEE